MLMSTLSATAKPNPPPARAGDGGPEVAVLGHLLDAHPRQLSLLDLAAELDHGLEGRCLQRAVANLCAAGLISREGQLLAAAPLALAFESGPPRSGARR
jgi:hypothetical protein